MMSWLPLLLAAFVFAGAVLVLMKYRLRDAQRRIVAPLRRRIGQQEDELRRLRDASDARNLFLATLSHELRTPLSGITGAIQLLQKTGLNSRQQEYARMAAYASTTVLEIVDDMLTFSRIQADKVSIENVMFSVRSVIDEMLSLQTIRAHERGVALVRDVAADVPAQVMGDRGKLNQILLNVIGNSVKFTDEGSVTVSVAVDPGRIDARDDRLHLLFTVSDTGVGIPPEQLGRVFKPFMQGGEEIGAGRGGTGLGLAICRRLVQAMGGEIRLESVLGAGTTVLFSLSFQHAPADTASSIDLPDGPAPLLRRSFTVLVVEDDEINRLVCTRYLALSGHHPLAAADLRQVLQLMENTSHIPDAVLLDMNLAGRSGADVLARIKAAPDSRWAHVPVVAMSADVSGAAQRRARQNGMEIFLPKPFTAAQLDAVLNIVVDQPANEKNALLSGSAALPSEDGLSALLDECFLQEEVDALGADVLLELLNIFRAGAATRLAAMAEAAGRKDWQAVATLAHALQGSAGNLGMRRVVLHARALQQIIMDEEGREAQRVLGAVDDLEVAVLAGADAVRGFLRMAAQQNVALAADGDD